MRQKPNFYFRLMSVDFLSEKQSKQRLLPMLADLLPWQPQPTITSYCLKVNDPLIQIVLLETPVIFKKSFSHSLACVSDCHESNLHCA